MFLSTIITYSEKMFPDHSDKSSKKQLEMTPDNTEAGNNNETAVAPTPEQNQPLMKKQWNLSKKILN